MDNNKDNKSSSKRGVNKTTFRNNNDKEQSTNNILDNDLSELEIIDDNLLNNLVETKDTDNSIKLKEPDEVYLELYKDARQKAKEAKKNAIEAFLKAKKIKDTYSLEEIDDSDDDLEDLLNN